MCVLLSLVTEFTDSLGIKWANETPEGKEITILRLTQQPT